MELAIWQRYHFRQVRRDTIGHETLHIRFFLTFTELNDKLTGSNLENEPQTMRFVGSSPIQRVMIGEQNQLAAQTGKAHADARRHEAADAKITETTQ